MRNLLRPLIQFVEHTSDQWTGRTPVNAARSKDWGTVRDAFLAKNPTCACCGGTKHLRVHHIIPFWVDSDLELAPTNLITLCEAKKFGINCHLLIGHHGNWRRWNPVPRSTARIWNLTLTEGLEHYVKRFVEYAQEGPHGNLIQENAANLAAFADRVAADRGESQVGPQKGPSSVPAIEAQTKQLAAELPHNFPHEFAARTAAVRAQLQQLAAELEKPE